VGHPAAGHRRDPKHLLGRLRQDLHPGRQHLEQRRRQGNLGAAGVAGQQLLGVERVTLRPGVDPLDLIGRQRLPCDRLQMSSQLRPPKGGQLHPHQVGDADQLGQQRPQRVAAVQLIRPVAAHQRDPT
jgi:hypothetical protein